MTPSTGPAALEHDKRSRLDGPESGDGPGTGAGGTRAPSRKRRLLRAAALAAAVGIPVTVLAAVVRSEASVVVRFDQEVVRAATDAVRDHDGLRQALLAWQAAFVPRWVNLAVSLVCLWVWRRHGLRTRALWAFVTLMVAWNLQLDIKLLVQRARPVVEDALTRAPGYSFPSGHATNTTAAGIVLVVLVWPLLGRRGRAALVTVVTAVVLVTGADRVLLGAHYPSDVVAGFALGAAMVGASYLGFLGRHHPEQPSSRRRPDDDPPATHEPEAAR